MSTTFDQAFVKQFEREVHQAYQRMGSKLRGTVRNTNNVNGATCVFQKVGKGIAGTKSTHGLVPVMNLTHSNVEATLQDYYAGDWVDKLDELKSNIDERQVIANAGAYALGRKTDELIFGALAQANSLTVAEANTGMTLDKALSAFEKLGESDTPDDGDRFAIVGFKQWSELLKIDEFSNADYVGAEGLPFEGGAQAKRWLGALWMPHSGLSKDQNDIRTCYMYHKTAVGHASGAEVQTDVTWHGDRASHFINNMMSQGAVLIDGYGVVAIGCDETPD